jgi:hypothetical protein
VTGIRVVIALHHHSSAKINYTVSVADLSAFHNHPQQLCLHPACMLLPAFDRCKNSRSASLQPTTSLTCWLSVLHSIEMKVAQPTPPSQRSGAWKGVHETLHLHLQQITKHTGNHLALYCQCCWHTPHFTTCKCCCCCTKQSALRSSTTRLITQPFRAQTYTPHAHPT